MKFTALLSLAACAALTAQDDGLNWVGDYQQALAESRKTGKPIFLEFRCEA